MSDLEQQVHEALETLRSELDRIKALLAEKDAALESLKQQLKGYSQLKLAYALADAELPEEFEPEMPPIARMRKFEESLKARAELAERALKSIEWIMVNGRTQCAACLHERKDGHGVLCEIDEALHPTPEKAEKAELRRHQKELYAKYDALSGPREGEQDGKAD